MSPTARSTGVSDSPSFFKDISSAWVGESAADTCVPWLEQLGLTRAGSTMLLDNDPHAQTLMSGNGRLPRGISFHRVEKRQRKDLEVLRKQREGALKWAPETLSRLYQEYKHPRSVVSLLDICKIPADALAFYRPFHIGPAHEWGIYLRVDRLMPYSRYLMDRFHGKLFAFNEETLLAYLLFEVFHHEFFHHLVESAATAVEILLASVGHPRRIYLDYWNEVHEQGPLGRHPHKPLEEALANAYAYNSLSFCSRVNQGYTTLLVNLYQEALLKCWPNEPAGYREAAHYIGAGHVAGAAQLLAMMLDSTVADPSALRVVAKDVLLHGHSALVQKPDMPTYLIGDDQVLQHFTELVPAPMEAYTNLFWKEDTSEVDRYFQEQKQKEKEAKKSSR